MVSVEGLRAKLESRDKKKRIPKNSEDLIFEALKDMIEEEGGGVLLPKFNSIMSKVYGYSSSTSSSILQPIISKKGKRNGILSISVYNALKKVYPDVNEFEYDKMGRNRTLIIYRNDVGLERYIRKHTILSSIPVVNCDF